jgi:hypothetical protein
MVRMLVVTIVAALTWLWSSGPEPMPLRPDTSRTALATLGQEYGDLQLWASAILVTTDTLPADGSESARAMAHQLAKLISPLEEDFAQMTAALSTAQLELVLPLWERMAFAHAGFAMLAEQVATLGGDPTLQPAELHEIAEQLSVVLDVAAELQRMVLEQLTEPTDTPIRIS